MKLARLQQIITVGTLMLSLLWAWLAWRAGHPAYALAGAALLAGGYALVLVLEFSLLRLAHGDDPTPRATLGQLLQAWWGEVKAAPTVFCWRQPFFSQRWPDLLPAGPPGAPQAACPPSPPAPRQCRGVLLIHGFVCNRGVWNLWLARLHAAQTPVVAVNLEPVFGSIDDYLLIVDDAVLKLEQATGLPPVVVAHSMGGLVLRRWWAEPQQEARIHHAITIGTPHQGTWLARFALTRNSRQMRRHSQWLAALGAREPMQRRARMTNFYSHCDNIVFPPATATLPGADNRHLPGVAHVQMADHPEPWHELQRHLAAEPAAVTQT
jgi:predicted alpha/beta hydrolase family esterase